MSILIFDEKNFELVVRCRPGESFTPDDEVKQLVKQFDGIRKEYAAIQQRLTEFLPKCTAWSRKHDSSLDTKMRKKEEKIQKKEPVEASDSDSAQN